MITILLSTLASADDTIPAEFFIDNIIPRATYITTTQHDAATGTTQAALATVLDHLEDIQDELDAGCDAVAINLTLKDCETCDDVVEPADSSCHLANVKGETENSRLDFWGLELLNETGDTVAFITNTKECRKNDAHDYRFCIEYRTWRDADRNILVAE